MIWLRRALAVLVPVAVLMVGAGSFVLLAHTRPEFAPSAPAERIWPVSAHTVTVGDFRPRLSVYGAVVAERPAELRASVGGDIVDLGDGFADGAFVAAGDLLVAIDPFDYEQAVVEQQASLDEARAGLDQLTATLAMNDDTLARNRELLEIAERDLARQETLAARGTVSASALDEARRTRVAAQQTVEASQNTLRVDEARVAQQEATVARLEAGARMAERNLVRTRLVAPFDGFVLDPAGDLGQRLSANERVATLIDPSRFEAHFQLSETQYGRLLVDGDDLVGRSATVVWSLGDARLEFAATVTRVTGALDATTGGVGVYARLDPLDADTPLRPGAFVEVILDDRTYADVAVLPATALHGDQVYVITAEDRLEPRQVQVADWVDQSVLIAGGINPGERVVTTRLSEVRAGARVEIR
ncbi:MAG: efflux RND transporter periplasmic adaptor subunit [Rhodospirillaceae bacterium]|nr:efflux RND transporter periplasmic adaptor subunit [Rhodospirillaceae bacterium]